jgi:hypothetical protein
MLLVLYCIACFFAAGGGWQIGKGIKDHDLADIIIGLICISTSAAMWFGAYPG